MNTEVISLSPVEEAVLLALARYRYLTPKQMMAAGVCRDQRNLYTVLSRLLSVAKRNGAKAERRPRYIGELDFGVDDSKAGHRAGRRARMYYLTKLGAEIAELAQPDLGEVSFPIRVTKFTSDYWHRVRTIDFHIALTQWAEHNNQELVWFQGYYDWSRRSQGVRPHPVTRVQTSQGGFYPDAIFLLRDATAIERLFAFEMANGMQTKRVAEKFRAYCRALNERTMHQNFGFPKNQGIRIVWLFEHQRQLELVCDRLGGDPMVREFNSFFFLKPYGELNPHGLMEDWRGLKPAHRKRLL